MNSPPIKKKRKKKDPLVGEVVGGRYQLLQRLASGGMGSVYAGRAVGAGGFERRLAIKLLHEHLAEREKFVAMFLDEARLAAKIHHPNVVSTLDVFEWDDRYFLVMEYVEGLELGRLLHAALTQHEKLPVRVVMRILLDALSGLVAAHELTDKAGKPLNLVHRDVSPQNIIVGADGISRLTDFGVAKAEDRIHVTQGVEFKGKVAYAAPEQLEHSIVEQRSDVFAMGIILWETLAQKRLFKAEDKHGVRRMILAGGYPTLSSIDPTLMPFDQLVEEAMAQDIDKRTPSAAELMRQVEEVAATIGGPASPNDVKSWVRNLAGAHLADRATELNEAEASVPYPEAAADAPISASARRGSMSQPPAAPDQSEVVLSGAGHGFNDPGPTSASRPQSLEDRPVTAHEVAARAEARRAADAASFDESATRQYDRRMPLNHSSPGMGADPPVIDAAPPIPAPLVLEAPPAAGPPRRAAAKPYVRDTSSISLELVDGESGRLRSGVELVEELALDDVDAAGPTVREDSPAGAHEDGTAEFGEGESSLLSASVIEAAARKHRGWFWFGAAVMLACALGIATAVVMSATEEPEPVYRAPVGEEAAEPEPAVEPAPAVEAPVEVLNEVVPEVPQVTEVTEVTEVPEVPQVTEVPAATTMRRRGMRRPAMRGMTPVVESETPATMAPDNSLADNPYRDI